MLKRTGAKIKGIRSYKSKNFLAKNVSPLAIKIPTHFVELSVAETPY
jgi:hypothetical protein